MVSTGGQHAESQHAALQNEDGSWKYTNQLVNQTSPYLLQHAHNPVDWYPWGEKAFELARQTGKPIFLSVGYSTCYWCHVMERQVFENPDIAAVMNDLYVNIKVDREERPDVDDVYMTAVQLIAGQGGWPMSVFLTAPGAAGEDDPGLKPFWAGTYIPPVAQYGRPGILDILNGLNDVWKNDRVKIIEQADRVAAAVQEVLNQRLIPGVVNSAVAYEAGSQIMAGYDSQHGGYGQAPKFPQVSNLNLLLKIYEINRDRQIELSLVHTFDRMARGGMYDQIGGGFHRYSTDQQWLVPHFEKMLYDNGQLAEAYTWAGELLGDEQGEYERIVRGICDYVLREMTDASGAFYSAQDAEVDAHEGKNYIWQKSELLDVLGDEQLATLAIKLYGLDSGTNFQDPHDASVLPANVLYLPVPLQQFANEMGISFEQLLDKKRLIDDRLYTARMERKQPGTDDKVLASWNGMMIAGLARAGRVYNEPRYIEAAQKAAAVILDNMRDQQGGLLRTMRQGQARHDVKGYLDDYAFFTHGLIELYRAGQNKQWLTAAGQLMDDAEQKFASEQGGGYYDMLANQKDLFVRTRGSYDGAIPSGNSQMIHNHLDLFKLTEDQSYRNLADKNLKAWSAVLKDRGHAMAHMQYAALRYAQLAGNELQFQTPRPSPVDDQSPVAISVLRNPVNESGFIIKLEIAEGYHINAHYPGLAMLIPTELALQNSGDWQLEVQYPDAISKRFPFADSSVNVYEGEVTVQATLKWVGDGESTPPHVRLRYQVCTDDKCLAPRDVLLDIDVAR